MITHLACIMDGNRRWAQERGMLPWLGTKAGVETAKQVISFCLEANIPYLSLYTFSIENLQRSAQEKNFLFSQLPKLFPTFGDELASLDVNVRFVGDRALFPESLQMFIDETESKTKHCTKLFLQLLFCYGGQQEIIAATQAIAHDVIQNNITPDQITQEQFVKYLWTGNCPAPDVIIRTGKQKRLSNFLLFQAAYAELFFLDILWPDISRSILEEVLQEFSESKRSFGK